MESLETILKTPTAAPPSDSASETNKHDRPDGLTYQPTFAFNSAIVSGTIHVVAGINFAFMYSTIETSIVIGNSSYTVRFTADELDTIATSMSDVAIIATILAEAPDKAWQAHFVEGRYGGAENLNLKYGYKQKMLSSNELNCVIKKPTWSSEDGWVVPVNDKTAGSFRDAAVAIRSYETLTAAHVEAAKSSVLAKHG